MLSMLGLAGCPSGSDLQKIAAANKDYGNAVSAVQEVEKGFYRLNKVTPQEHIVYQTGFDDLADIGKELNQALKVAQSKQGVMDAIDKGLASLDRLLTEVTSGNNEEARMGIRTQLQLARGALSTIKASIGG